MKNSWGTLVLALFASTNLGVGLFFVLQAQDNTGMRIGGCIFLGISLFTSLGTIIFAIRGLNDVAGMISIPSNLSSAP